MSEAVLDASAVLALLGIEPGHEAVLPHLPGAHMSAVNHAEVLSKLVDAGIPIKSARTYIQRLGIAIDDFGEPAAIVVAELRDRSRSAGLSLGDRACLALAQQRGCIAVTADRAWVDVDLGVDILVVR